MYHKQGHYDEEAGRERQTDRQLANNMHNFTNEPTQHCLYYEEKKEVINLTVEESRSVSDIE